MTVAGVLASLSLLIQPAYASPGDIVTVAGGGVGDGSLATSANLVLPVGVAVDTLGNLYVSDGFDNYFGDPYRFSDNRIRKVDINGVISTVAGNGDHGFSGDGGLATASTINQPGGIAVDSTGNLFFADSDNNRVRRVDASSGVISTVAGNGTAGYSGDGGQAADASLNYPQGVAVDSSGNLFIADTGNDRIRKVDAMGVISSVAGPIVDQPRVTVPPTGGLPSMTVPVPVTVDGLRFPFGVNVDSSGNLFIADTGNNRILKVDASGTLSTVAGNGIDPSLGGSTPFLGDGLPATMAYLSRPRGVALDPSGNILIADTGDFRIRKVDTSTGVISTVAGDGSYAYDSGEGTQATAASLPNPEGVAVDSSGSLYIADTYNHRIRRVDTAGVISTVAGGHHQPSGNGGQATAASLDGPQGVAVDSSGNLYIADALYNRIRKVDASSGVISTVAGNGPWWTLGDGGQATDAGLDRPLGIAVDSSGNLFIADTDHSLIRRVDASSGVISTVAGNGSLRHEFSGDGGQATDAALAWPMGVAVDSSGNLFIADTYHNAIRKVDTSGVISTVVGTDSFGCSEDGGQAKYASLASPSGVAVDSVGNLIIANSQCNQIAKVDTSGVLSTVAGNGSTGYSGDGGQATAASLNSPDGVTVDSSGNIYIADTLNNAIRKVDTSGVLSTVAGNGSTGYSGDGGQATAASLNSPCGATVDYLGNLFIADTGNDRIRKVNTA